jgi:hypothetical protein
MRSVAALPEPVAVLNPIWLVGMGEIGSAKAARTAAYAPALKAGQLPVDGGDSLLALGRAVQPTERRKLAGYHR